VDDVSLSLDQGDAVALWGSNGAGKTTLIRCVLGLLRYRGAIRVGGIDVRRNGKAARMLIGYVPQELGFYDELRVDSAICYFARLKGIPSASPAASGGMKQRLALAIALLGDPPILVLDEVTASLDALGRHEFVGLLRQLTGSGRTLLFASHRLEEVRSLARRVAVLERGRLLRIDDCACFAPDAQHAAVLHLHLSADERMPAIRALAAEGFSPTLNGTGILVPVASEHKAAPFRILADAQIAVDNFEVDAVEHSSATPEPGGGRRKSSTPPDSEVTQ
jgi:ABC-2 type transport system ATP-binding protein/nitrous oxidase accessory protein